jgi:MFS family permease
VTTSDPLRPVTYTDVMRNREFRALYLSDVLSVVGDQVAKVALTVLVYERSGSPLLAAVAYAAAFLPWLIGGPVLSPLADRYSRRRVMLDCDAARVPIVAAMALPFMPLWALVALLFLVGMLSPPFEAARSAMLPDVLEGDAYVVGLSLSGLSLQPLQIVGFLFGGSVVGLLGTRNTLLVDAATFAISYVIIRARVRERPPAPVDGPRRNLLVEAHDGVRAVFASPVLRSILLLAWVGAAFAVVPEGLAVTYADAVGGGSFAVGLLMSAAPLGFAVAAVAIGRFTPALTRHRLMLPLAAGAFLPLLAFAVMTPPVAGAVALLALSGAGMSFQLPANAAYVAAVPAVLRGRAFALAQSGLQVFQGVTVVGGGALALRLPVARVIAVAGALGLTGVALLAAQWPRDDVPSDGDRFVRPLEPSVDGALSREQPLDREAEEQGE